MRAVVSDTLAERLDGLRRRARRPVARDRARRHPGPAVARDPGAAHRRRPRRAALLRASPRATVAGIPALVARTGYTGEDGFEVFVDTSRTGELWDVLLEAGRPHGLVPVGSRRPRHAPPRGRHAALRQRARPDDDALRRRPRPGRQARQAGRLRRSRRAREGRPRRDRRAGSSASSFGSAGSPATATRSTSASDAPGVVTSGTQSPTLGRARSRWPTSHPAMPNPVRCWMSRSAGRASPPRSSRCRSTGGRLRPTALETRPPRSDPRAAADTALHQEEPARWSPPTCATPGTTSGSASRATRPTVGITQYAADQLGDIVFVELPDVGRSSSRRHVRRRRVGQGGQRPVRARLAAR